jgi:hypothetical protein
MNLKGHLGTSIFAYTIIVSPIFLDIPISEPLFIYLLIFMIMGERLVDTIDFQILKRLYDEDAPYYEYHRKWTHGLLSWTLISIYALNSGNINLIFFVFGVLMHLSMDVLTGKIPLLIYGSPKIGIKINNLVELGDKFFIPLIMSSILITISTLN